MAILGILRHAQTLDNVCHRKQGVDDSPLTRDGVKTAVGQGRVLSGRFVKVYCSDLGRAVRTCELLDLGLPVAYTHLLRERDWRGETDAQLGARLTEFVQTEDLNDALIVTHGRTARVLTALLSGALVKDVPVFANCECRMYELATDMLGFTTLGRLLNDFA